MQTKSNCHWHSNKQTISSCHGHSNMQTKSSSGDMSGYGSINSAVCFNGQSGVRPHTLWKKLNGNRIHVFSGWDTYLAYAFSIKAGQNSFAWMLLTNISWPLSVGRKSSMSTCFQVPKCQKLKRNTPEYQPSWKLWPGGTILSNKPRCSGADRQAIAATNQQSPVKQC